jgi:putative transposase
VPNGPNLPILSLSTTGLQNPSQQFSHLNKECWGRHLWARGFFVASSGVITDEAILEYIRTQDVTKEDGDFKVDDE